MLTLPAHAHVDRFRLGRQRNPDLVHQLLALPQLEQTPTTQHLISDENKRPFTWSRHLRRRAQPHTQPAGKNRHLVLHS